MGITLCRKCEFGMFHRSKKTNKEGYVCSNANIPNKSLKERLMVFQEVSECAYFIRKNNHPANNLPIQSQSTLNQACLQSLQTSSEIDENAHPICHFCNKEIVNHPSEWVIRITREDALHLKYGTVLGVYHDDCWNELLLQKIHKGDSEHE